MKLHTALMVKKKLDVKFSRLYIRYKDTQSTLISCFFMTYL